MGRVTIRLAHVAIGAVSIFVGISLFAPTAFPYPSVKKNLPPVKLTPEEIATSIKEAARQLVESQSLVIKKTEFTVDEKNKIVNYRLGGVEVDYLGLEGGDPYLFPFQKQIYVESLNRLFRKSIPGELFWKEYLDNIDRIILESIRNIESISDNAKLQEALSKNEEDVSKQIRALKESIKQFAIRKGFAVKEYGRDIASVSFSVAVSTDPSDGRVTILPYVKYVQCKVLNKCGSEWPWRELVSKEENLIGSYYYQAEWPDGRRSEGRIEIRNATGVTFKPKK